MSLFIRYEYNDPSFLSIKICGFIRHNVLVDLIG